MPVQALQGSDFTTEDKLDELRQQIHGKKFQNKDEVRQFVNRYIAAHPDEVRDKSTSIVNEIVGNIRSELGLGLSDQPGVTKVISDQVKNLILGRAQASEDTARWAVHHAANQVTMYSGQFVYDAEDIFIDGAGMDFLFHRIYKSQGYYNGPLGINWDHNYNLRLRKVDSDQKIARLTGGFQETNYVKHGLYGQTGCNYWVPPTGEHSIIIDISSLQRRQEYDVQLPQSCQNCRYALRTADGVLYVYENDSGLTGHYRIKRIQGRFGNYLGFIYEQSPGEAGSRIRQIFVNSPARKVLFGYDLQNRITAIKDYAKRIWRYTYDDSGDLISFTTPGTDRYKSGLTERYVYSTLYYTGELQHNLTQVYDTAGRFYIENKYGTDTGLLSLNRVVRQREGNGERFLEYEDVNLATGPPTGQPEIEEDTPVHQTVMTRRNGHPVHYIYNKFGNLIAREENVWASGIRRRLVTHYRYNRDGALIGEISPEGRMTQYLYGRDEFIRHAGDLTEDQLRQLNTLTWKKRLSFGNRLAIVQRYRKMSFSAFQYPSQLRDLQDVANHPKDIIVKFTYEDKYQNITNVSDPQYTDSPFLGSMVNPDPNPKHKATLTIFEYDTSKKFLKSIKYPHCTRDGQPEVTGIEENFLSYDQKGRLTKYKDRVGTRTDLVYFTASDGNKEGYLRSQITDPQDQSNPDGLDLRTKYEVNHIGVTTQITTPKNQVIKFDVDNLNRVKKVTRTLKPGVNYETRYTYCRNMRVERIERDVQDENGQPLWGGTEVQFFHFDENDNVSREQIGSLDFDGHLATSHTYDDGELRVGTVLPRGNRVHIANDERRLPKKITRGAGSKEAVEVKVTYDGDGLMVEQRDGRNLKTPFTYDAFGRVVETRDYDEQNNLCRLIRQDYDKADNLTIERLFVPDGSAYKLLYHTSYFYNELNQRIESRLRRFQSPIAYNAADVKKDDDNIPLSEVVRTLYFYDKAGWLTRVEQHGRRLDANGQPQPNDTVLASPYEYNAVGWPIAETDQLGNRTETRYDKHGLVKRVDVREKVPLTDSPTGEEVFTTLYKYDNLDRLTTITDSLGNVTSFEYDSRDTIIHQTDPLGNVTRYEYDIYGRQVAELIEMTDTGLGCGLLQPNSDIVTQYVYDANGNLIRLINVHNISTHQLYDALDRRIESRYVDGTATTYKYDGNDNVVWEKDNNGLIRKTSYDPLDNPLRMDVQKSKLEPGILVEGATYEAFEYDVLGQMTRARNDWTDIRLKVDSLGRVYEESVKFSALAPWYTIKRTYDDFNFPARFTYSNGRIIAYQPDELNRIKRIENQVYGAGYPGHTNLPSQRLLLENIYRGLRIGKKTYGNSAFTDYAYDGTERVISIAHRGAQNTELLTIQHLYDAAGNMRFKYEYAPSDNYGEVYKYDSRYQLTRYQPVTPPTQLALGSLGPAQAMPPVTPTFTNQAQIIDPMLGSLAQVPNQFTFKYDKLGNRQEERALNQTLISYIANNLNQYTQRDNTQYAYDPNGNLRKEQSGSTIRDYFYNHRNQIVRVTEGGNLAQFRYDALGRRIWSDTGGVAAYFLYDDENVIEEWRPAVQQPTKLSAQYVNEFGIDSRCQIAVDNLEHWYHKDLIGSARVITNVNGAESAFYQFTPFGVWNLAGPLPSLPNAYLFAGRLFDKKLGKYDLRARSYSPELGRFLQRDPKGYEDSMNLLGYVGNNPLCYTDPEGMIPFGGSKEEVKAIEKMIPASWKEKAGKAVHSGTIHVGNFVWNLLTQNPIYQSISQVQDIAFSGFGAITDTDTTKHMVSNIGKESARGATTVQHIPQVVTNILETPMMFYGSLPKHPVPRGGAVVSGGRGARRMPFTARVSSKMPGFPEAKLERILTNLEKKGVTVVRGEAAEAALKLSKEGSAMYRARSSRPGTLFLGKNPSRLEVLEEVIHLGQHRKASWQLPSKRALWEIETQKRLLQVRDLTQEEALIIKRNLEYWQSKL